MGAEGRSFFGPESLQPPEVFERELFSYSVYGLTLEAPFRFPELIPSESLGDLKIELGDISSSFPLSNSFSFSKSGCLVDYADLAGIRMKISDGATITVMPVNERFDPSNVHEFLQGACLAAVLLQRKALPLHGNVVDTEEGAVALMGLPRAGKSTTSALFVQRGYSLISDDICAVKFDEENHAQVMPGIPRVKLRHESLNFLGLGNSKLELVPPGTGKYYWPVKERFQPSSRPIKRIYILKRSECASVSIRHLFGAEKLKHLVEQIYRFGAHQLVAPFPWLVPELAKLANQTSIALVDRPLDGKLDCELVDLIEADLSH